MICVYSNNIVRSLIILCFMSMVSTFALGQERTLFTYGGQVTSGFIQYTAELTGKERPTIMFMPTGTADHQGYINLWYELSAELDIVPRVLRVWINSNRQPQSWEEQLEGVDAVIVGGGNTLNMLAIWRAQGIDLALQKAYNRGVVMAGGSAGSLCWFQAGTTDSRPKALSIVQGLAWLPYSHCPHYHSEASRQPLYFDNIKAGKLTEGYACDDLAGLVFVNELLDHAVTLDQEHASYYVSLSEGEVIEEEVPAKLLRQD